MVWLFSRRRTETQPLTPAVDADYYRQRPRRAVQLLVDRVSQLSNQLNTARQEIAELKINRERPPERTAPATTAAATHRSPADRVEAPAADHEASAASDALMEFMRRNDERIFWLSVAIMLLAIILVFIFWTLRGA
jgi:hypothetical protein